VLLRELPARSLRKRPSLPSCQSQLRRSDHGTPSYRGVPYDTHLDCIETPRIIGTEGRTHLHQGVRVNTNTALSTVSNVLCPCRFAVHRLSRAPHIASAPEPLSFTEPQRGVASPRAFQEPIGLFCGSQEVRRRFVRITSTEYRIALYAPRRRQPVDGSRDRGHAHRRRLDRDGVAGGTRSRARQIARGLGLAGRAVAKGLRDMRP